MPGIRVGLSLLLAVAVGLSAQATAAERDTAESPRPVPFCSVAQPPRPPRETYEAPSIHAVEEGGSEKIVLQNFALTLELQRDAAQQVRITSLKTEAGCELLAEPSAGFSILDGDGTPFRDASGFKLETWHAWLHNSYAEVELRLRAPEPVVWRLRLDRQKPWLEQSFELPHDWRTGGRTLVVTLLPAVSLRPVMPVNPMKFGFAKGVSAAPSRNSFEFVERSEHLIYDPDRRGGLAAFVVGPGGEESLSRGKVVLTDHATAALGDEDPVAKIVLFPFDGAVEKGFHTLRRFLAEEYSCQQNAYCPFLWNQFWLWQGKHADWGYQECTAARLLDILPHLQAMGVEMLHVDAGWEKGLVSTPRPTPQDWAFDPERFPQGFAPLRKYLREHSMGYATHLFTEAINNPEITLRIVEETDLDKMFLDARANEKTLAAMRRVRARYPGLEVFVHSMDDPRRAASYWKWGNLHYLGDFNQVYFGEGTWAPFLNDLPPEISRPRFVDLFTRVASYQATWVWPYKCLLPPHGGYTFAGMSWYIPEMGLSDASSYVLTTISSRYLYEWGDDPRLLKPEILNYFLDWTAFWKTIRPYLQDSQHVGAPPDGIHVDGVAHLQDGQGFLFLFNPGTKPAEVSWKDVFWSPELELDPRRPAELSDWTQPLAPIGRGSVDLNDPQGHLTIEPLGSRVLGVNLDLDTVRGEVQRQRSLLHGPP